MTQQELRNFMHSNEVPARDCWGDGMGQEEKC